MARKRFTSLQKAFFEAEQRNQLSENYKICAGDGDITLTVKYSPIGIAVANDVFIEELVGETVKRKRIVPVGDTDPNKDGDIKVTLGRASDLTAKKLYIHSTVAATAASGAPVKAKLVAVVTGCPKEWRGSLEMTIKEIGGSVPFLIELTFF